MNADKTLEFTGERFTPECVREIFHEHFHRYAWARGLVGGLDVLDCACGEGYGSRILADTARSVHGVDIDAETIEHATRRYATDGLSFTRASALELPFEDDRFDAVVSFETLEHLAEQDELMREFRRVLKPGGFVLISSPDKKTYSDDTGFENEFHVRELYRDQFEALLDRYFPNFRLFGQKLMFNSALWRLDAASGPAECLTSDADGSVERTTHPRSGPAVLHCRSRRDRRRPARGGRAVAVRRPGPKRLPPLQRRGPQPYSRGSPAGRARRRNRAAEGTTRRPPRPRQIVAAAAPAPMADPATMNRQAGPSHAALARVDVLIVNYNAGDWLARCIARLRPDGAEEPRVVVVDNGSTDSSLQALDENGLTIDRLGRNTGFAAGVNRAASQATREFLLILNPDCLIEPATLARLVDELDRHPDCALVSGKVLDTDGKEQRGSRRRLPTPARIVSEMLPLGGAGIDLTNTPAPNEAVEVEAVSGACMLVRRRHSNGSAGWTKATRCISRIWTCSHACWRPAGRCAGCRTSRSCTPAGGRRQHALSPCCGPSIAGSGVIWRGIAATPGRSGKGRFGSSRWSCTRQSARRWYGPRPVSGAPDDRRNRIRRPAAAGHDRPQRVGARSWLRQLLGPAWDERLSTS